MTRPPTSSRQLWILLAITGLGAFLRFYRLDTLPPGDGYDVAQYGVDALRILGGARPVFFETNFGREAFFSYLVAAAYLVVGPGTLGIRIASALAGTLTIPAVFLLTRELIPDRRDLLRFAPLLAALLTAISYWHLNWSRMGLRVILVPLIAALLFTFLWRGLRRQRWTDFAMAGLLLGAGFYTYQAARLLPVLVAIAFALFALANRSWTRHNTAQVLLVTALALLVYVPMGLYARDHPGVLTERIDQAALLDTAQPLGPQVSQLGRQALNALAMYGIRGDQDPLFTIPGRPSLNPILFAFLLAGIAAALWRFRRPTYPFLLAWLAVMTAPAMIADLAATAKRALGAFPAVVILIALGVLVPWVWLRENGRRRVVAEFYGTVVVIGLAASAWITVRDYFVVWAADPDLPNHFQTDYREIGRAIGRLPADEQVYLSPYPPDQPVIQLHSALRPGVRGYNGRFCLPYPDPDTGNPAPALAYVIVPGLQDQSLALLQRLYPDGVTANGPPRPNSDRPMFRTFRVPAGSTPVEGPAAPAAAVWEDQVELVGYSLGATSLRAGETLAVDLYYRPRATALPDYTAFVHLLGPANPATGGPVWAQSDSPPCQGAVPTSRWAMGDILRDTVTITIPAETPPGGYQLTTGFYSWPDLVRLPLNGSAETALTLGEIEVRAAD